MNSDIQRADDWVFPEQIADSEPGGKDWLRRKYKREANRRRNPDDYMRAVRSNGGLKLQFRLSLLDESTQQKYLASKSSPEQTAIAPLSPAVLFPAEFPEGGESCAMAEKKLRVARARERAIAFLIPNRSGQAPWQRLKGREVHGVLLGTREDGAEVLARDSAAPQPALAGWSEIRQNIDTPVSKRTLQRWYGWYTKGRSPLAPGIESLQPLDRCDKGQIHLHPAHAEHLVSLCLSGDRTVKKARIALQRPRSARECWEWLKLEIEVGGDLPTPAPSYYLVRRFYHEELPAILRKIASGGLESGWLRNKPYIPHLHPEAQVNDVWYCDFRSTNVSTWTELDGKLYRIYLCGIMDHASRDVTVCYDFRPSARLFKSTLWLALLTWGVPQEVWMDNGKEFTCQEVSGDGTRHWAERFTFDDDSKSVFSKLGIEPHYCLPKNPDGKSPLERFFQQLDRLERQFPGWTGEKGNDGKRSFGRPDRWKHELKLHRLFCANELPETPLWTVDQLVQFETRWIAAKYRALTRLHGLGLHGRTPGQVQAAFKGVRRIPDAAELDLLLWYRRKVRARGDKISVEYHGRTLVFRSERLLGLAGDCETEVHVDPINAQRAVALDLLGKLPPIVLEPCEPRERSGDELAREMERQNGLRKRILGATLLASRMAPVRGPEEYLALVEQAAREKQRSLAAATLNPAPERLELPEYAAAVEAIGDRPRPDQEVSSVEFIGRRLGLQKRRQKTSEEIATEMVEGMSEP